MIRVGVIGLGTMGQTHLDAYARRCDCKVVAVADRNPDRLLGKSKAEGNIEGQARGAADLSSATRYDEGHDLIRDPDVQLIDICLPTPMHLDYALASLAAGKHLMIEKPLARTHEQALRLVEAAADAPGHVMVGMCMRFWPGWDWLKQAVAEETYGRVLSASFRRVAQHPGGAFYRDGQASGGALLDLHIHDTDFVRYCFGNPQAVSSVAHRHVTGHPDHVVTQYVYPDGPVVTAEGGWAMAEGFGFSMRYTVNFEFATADFELGRDPALRLARDGQTEAVALPEWMGYDAEVGYFLDCLAVGCAPQRVTLADAAESIRLVEAEGRSIEAGVPVEVEPAAVAS